MPLLWLLLLIIYCVCGQYPYVCEETTIRIDTPHSAYEFLNCTPTLFMFKKESGKQLDDFFRWEFLHPIERNETGGEVPLPIPTPDLGSTNETTYTFWAHHVEPFFYEGREIGVVLTFTTPTTYIVTYHVVNETYNYSLNGRTYTVEPGGFKVDFFINDWYFRSPNNSLEFPLSISSDRGMKDCTLSKHNEFQDKFHCRGEQVDFLEYAQTFVTINNSTLHPMKYKLKKRRFAEREISSSCEDGESYSVREGVFLGTVAAYEGVLFYDPDVSLLLAGKTNNNGCKSSELNQIVLWLSVSFTGFALILSLVLIAIILTVRPLRDRIYGKEATRIWHVRAKRREFSRSARESFVDDSTAEP